MSLRMQQEDAGSSQGLSAPPRLFRIEIDDDDADDDNQEEEDDDDDDEEAGGCFKVSDPAAADGTDLGASKSTGEEIDAAQALLGVSPNTVVVTTGATRALAAGGKGPLMVLTPASGAGAGTGAPPLHGFGSASAATAGYASSSIPSWARGNTITQAQPLAFVTSLRRDSTKDCTSGPGSSLPQLFPASLPPPEDKVPVTVTHSQLEAPAPQLLQVSSLSAEAAEAAADNDDSQQSYSFSVPATTTTTTTVRRGRSGSVGLDALAEAVAASEDAEMGGGDDMAPHLTATNVVSSGHATPASGSSAAPSEDESSDDSEIMPPPPPRHRRNNQRQQTLRRRPRSVSNPEGMTTTTTTTLLMHADHVNDHHFRLVLPESVLEEELARVSAVVKRRRRNGGAASVSMNPCIPEEEEGDYGEDEGEGGLEGDGSHGELEGDEEAKDGEDYGGTNYGCSSSGARKLDSEELLRRARARLFEDLMLEGKMGGGAVEKGILALPHSFDRYKEIYNRDGRIGIYTPSERAAIIERFMQKRSRRVWNKKIRYDCRKNLADRRLRVKGRFVKRSEQEQLERTAATSKGGSGSDAEEEGMPNVSDPEAGFVPTEEQPYRRLRRHTVT